MQATTNAAIKASELRIGNYLTYSPSAFIATVRAIYTDDEELNQPTILTDVFDTEKEVSDFEGVVLTPEILEKCGFVKWDEVHEYSLEVVSDLYINFSKGKVALGIQGNTCGLGNEPKEMFLHQLQNLYFALTGEELQINL